MDVKRLAEYLCTKYNAVIITALSDKALIMFDNESAYDTAVSDKALKGYLWARGDDYAGGVFLAIAITNAGLQDLLE